MTPIEYIGPVPNKKKPKPKFGGAIIILLVTLFVVKFAWPFFEGVAHASQDQPTPEKADALAERLLKSHQLNQQIAGAAIKRTSATVSYDPAYSQIPYPMGDIPMNKGMNTDLVIRSLRTVNIDLQQLIHEDMSQYFSKYPQLWTLKEADPNIDHRRIENIQRYLKRHHISNPTIRENSAYDFGNIVVWRLPKGDLHIGIIVPGPGSHSAEKWIVHNKNSSPSWENILFDYNIIGNFTIRHD